jgi:branched-subunit amino acid ABC-type transport system permease component
MHAFVAALGFGIVTAAILAIGSVGFTLQFGATNVFNLAFGSTMTASAFVAYQATEANLGLWGAVLAGAIFGVVFSVLLNRFVYMPFIRRGARLFEMIIVAIAVTLLMSNGVQAIWGAGYFTLKLPPSPAVSWGALTFSRDELGIVGVAIVAMLGVHWLLSGTRLGQAMRATATNATLARNCGIPTRRVIDVVWGVSGLLCGLSGVALVLVTTTFGHSTGTTFIIPILAVAVLGGIGQPYGAMLGAVVIGLMTELSPLVISAEYKQAVAFVILIVVLLIRPQGILSEIAEQKEVVA